MTVTAFLTKATNVLEQRGASERHTERAVIVIKKELVLPRRIKQ